MSLGEYEEVQTEGAWLEIIANLPPLAGAVPPELMAEIGQLREERGLFFAIRRTETGRPRALSDAIVFVRTVVVVLGSGVDKVVLMGAVRSLSGLSVRSISDFPVPEIFLVELNLDSLGELALAISKIRGLGGIELVEEISFQPTARARAVVNDELSHEMILQESEVLSLPTSGCAEDVDLGIQDQWSKINIIDAWAKGSHASGHGCGQGVRVAVIDSGFDLKPLNGTLATERNCTFSSSSWHEEMHYLDSGKDDRNSHGVACAGLIGARPLRGKKRSSIGAAPACGLCLIRIREDQLESPQQMGLALWWATRVFGSEIISCSLGPDSDGRRASEFLLDTIRRCEALPKNSGGSLLCFASPRQTNQPRDVDQWTATCSIVLVGSWVDEGSGAYKSAGVQGVDILAPAATAETLYTVGGGTFLGTSAGAPLVAGAAALIAGHFPQLTVPQLRDALLKGSDTSQINSDWKLLNVAKALQEAENSAAPPP